MVIFIHAIISVADPPRRTPVSLRHKKVVTVAKNIVGAVPAIPSYHQTNQPLTITRKDHVSTDSNFAGLQETDRWATHRSRWGCHPGADRQRGFRELSERVSKLELWQSWLKGGWAVLAAAFAYVFRGTYGK